MWQSVDTSSPPLYRDTLSLTSLTGATWWPAPRRAVVKQPPFYYLWFICCWSNLLPAQGKQNTIKYNMPEKLLLLWGVLYWHWTKILYFLICINYPSKRLLLAYLSVLLSIFIRDSQIYKMVGKNLIETFLGGYLMKANIFRIRKYNISVYYKWNLLI